MILGLIIIGVVIVLLLAVRAINYPVRIMKKQGYYIQIDIHGRVQYNKLIDYVWNPINFKLERYAEGAPRHIIHIPEDWSEFPDWAQEEKEIILERLKNRFKSPAYTFR